MTPHTTAPATVTNKASLRKLLRMQRQSLSQEHRVDAADKVQEKLKTLLEGKKIVGSYFSINEELDTSRINQQLLEEGRLTLPRLDGENLQLFHVKTLDDLVEGSFGILEPNPSLCSRVSIEEVEAVLVPGIAFDSLGYRLGYGKGFYDRLLEHRNPECLVVGIAFKEQVVNYPLPIEAHDQPMSQVITD